MKEVDIARARKEEEAMRIRSLAIIQQSQSKGQKLSRGIDIWFDSKNRKQYEARVEKLLMETEIFQTFSSEQQKQEVSHSLGCMTC